MDQIMPSLSDDLLSFFRQQAPGTSRFFSNGKYEVKETKLYYLEQLVEFFSSALKREEVEALSQIAKGLRGALKKGTLNESDCALMEKIPVIFQKLEKLQKRECQKIGAQLSQVEASLKKEQKQIFSLLHQRNFAALAFAYPLWAAKITNIYVTPQERSNPCSLMRYKQTKALEKKINTVCGIPAKAALFLKNFSLSTGFPAAKQAVVSGRAALERSQNIAKDFRHFRETLQGILLFHTANDRVVPLFCRRPPQWTEEMRPPTPPQPPRSQRRPRAHLTLVC